MSDAPRAPLDARPEPLTPADCDLRGLPFMALDVVRLLDSDFFALATGEEFKAGVALWCKSWNQLPAASLPMNDRVLAHLAGAGQKEWPRLRDMALHGWVEHSDGRLYHPVVAEKALEAWADRQQYRSGKSSEAERQAKHRKERSALFAGLKVAGVVPHYNTKTSELRSLAAQHGVTVNADDVTRDDDTSRSGRDVSRDGQRDGNGAVTAKKGTGRGTGITEEEADASPSDAGPAGKGRARPDGEWDALWREITSAYAERVIRGRGSPMQAKSAWLRLAPDDRRAVLPAIRPFAAAAPWGSNGPPGLSRFIGDEVWREFAPTATVTDIAWRGPPDLRAAVIAEAGEGFARSYLDPAEWRPPSADAAPALIPLNLIAAQKLRPLLALRGVAIQDPILPRKSA